MYGAEVRDAIHLVAKALDSPCTERLTPQLLHATVQAKQPDAYTQHWEVDVRWQRVLMSAC